MGALWTRLMLTFCLLMFLLISGRTGSLLLHMGIVKPWREGVFSLASALGLVAMASLAVVLRPRSRRAWAGSVAPWRVESPITGQTCVPCSGRGMLNHCITEEAPVRSWRMSRTGNIPAGNSHTTCVHVSVTFAISVDSVPRNKVIAQSCPTPCHPTDWSPARLLSSLRFSRQERWGGLPCPPPGALRPHSSSRTYCASITWRRSYYRVGDAVIIWELRKLRSPCIRRIFTVGGETARSDQKQKAMAGRGSIIWRLLIKKFIPGTSLVVQRLRLHLPMHQFGLDPWSGSKDSTGLPDAEEKNNI